MKKEYALRFAVRTPDGSLGCTLRAERGFVFVTETPCSYGEDTAAYAACRFIRHCPELRDRLVREAVRLGLTTGKGAGKRTRRVRTTAKSLELPGRRALLTLSVQQGEIVVRRLEIDTRAAR